MSKQVRIFLAGALVLVPLAVTVWVIWSVGSWLDRLGTLALQTFLPEGSLPAGVGAVVVVAAIYTVGLLTHLWVFRSVFGWLERLVARVPGVKTIYESVRDLMKLFGGDSRQMGRAVQYRPPGTDIALLGILTNDNPTGLAGGDPKVALYLPYSYMFGGPTIYVSREHVQNVDMSVEQALKICTTANVGAGAAGARPSENASRKPEDETHAQHRE